MKNDVMGVILATKTSLFIIKILWNVAVLVKDVYFPEKKAWNYD